MTWVVDIGNTSLKWAACHDGKLAESGSVMWRQAGLAETLDDVWGSASSPGSIICSCVAGQSDQDEISNWCRDVWQIEPRFIQASANACGVVNAYTEVDHLGSDRWATLIAAKNRYEQACCIVDCGTAATIDVLQADGMHLGGLILPGITLMRSSLLANTNINIDDSEGSNSTLFARNTRDAIHGGGLYAMIATVDRIFQDVENELAVPVTRILTGGDANTLLPLLKGSIIHEPDLVLQGLAIIAQESNNNEDAE